MPSLLAPLPLIGLGLLFALPAHALELRYPDIPGFGKLNDVAGNAGLAEIVNFLFYGALWLAGLLAFGALVYAGFMLAVSAGNPQHRVEAKQRIGGIIFGVFLLLGAYLTLRTINPDLVFLRNSSFSICTDKGGFIECPTLSIADLPIFKRGSSPASSPTTALGMFHVCLYDIAHKTADGTEALPVSSALVPTNSKISGCNDKIEKSVDYLGAEDAPLGGKWDDRASIVILVGNGRFTLYANPNFAEGQPQDSWIEIVLDGGKWECQNQLDNAERSVDCIDDLLANADSEKNHTDGVPIAYLDLTQMRKAGPPGRDMWGGLIPLDTEGVWPDSFTVTGDWPDISSIKLEPRSFTGTCQIPSSGACSPGALSAFGEHASEAAQICLKESGGNVSSLNDTCKVGRADYSVGLFQVNLYRTCRCPGAWAPTCAEERAMNTWTCPWPPLNQEILDQCAREHGLGDATANIQKSLGISSNGTNWCPWSTALACGLC